MKAYLITFLKSIGIEPTLSVVSGFILIIIILTAIIIHFLLHGVVFKVLRKVEAKKRNVFTKIFIGSTLMKRFALLLQAIIVQYQADIWIEDGLVYELLTVTVSLWIIISALLLTYSILDKIFNLFFARHSASLAFKTILQSAKLILGLVALVYIISVLVHKSPIAILSGLGAMSAVLMLVFKDTILGFSASLQLTTNKMVQIGDWIEMPKYGADGDVIDIGLNVVKVRNFDKTITTIPTYALVSDSFKNWRGMQEAGGRRIKRSVYIDVKSIGFLSDEDIKRLKKANLLAPYLEDKEKEIGDFNKDFDLSVALNGRRLTNLGTYRAYLDTYLKNHPRISKRMTTMVRQLSPKEHGLPLEIYCFTDTTVWTEYENIQSDIFDHAFSVLKEFGLKPYQMR